MKTSKLFLAIIVFIIVAGCIKITSPITAPMNDKGEYAIVFSNSSAATKATVTTIAGNGYDEFGLYAWNSNGDIVMNPFIVQADGDSSYKYDGVNGQSLQYFKNNANSYSFIGVIPTSSTTLNNGSVKVGVESFVVDDKRAEGNGIKADSPKEFLWARADVVKANYSQTVTLPFKHGNALLYLGFISDDANTQIIDYTPHVDYQPAIPGTPGDTTVNNIKTKVLDALKDGYIVGWPYDEDNQASTSAGNPRLTINNYGNMTQEIANKVNAQFIYYTDAKGTTIKTGDFGSENKKNKIYIKLAPGVKGQDIIDGNDEFIANASDDLKAYNRVQACYNNGWRVVKIDKSYGGWTLWFLSNTTKDISVTTITGGTPDTPEIPESGFKGIRVFSAQADVTNGYAHLAHTKTADATVATGLTFDNRVTTTDSIQFSLPGVVVPVGTTEAQAIYSPTTFYAIPGDAGLTHFVVKLSYTYKGTTVYDVRVPITLPASGLEAGKYYKYIINITSTANGTNDPDEANNKKDDISITKSPIKVAVDVTDYTEGDMQIIKI